MSLIDLDKKKLLDRLNNLKDSYTFPEIDKKSESYFDDYDRDNMQPIEEFSFNTIPELKLLLERNKLVVSDEQIDILCAITAFKNRPNKGDMMKQRSVENGKTNDLPEFIYNF